MSTANVSSFVVALCQSRLLDAQQQDKLTRKLQYRFADPNQLAQDLVRRGWVTPQQVGAMLGGKAPSYQERKAASNRRWMLVSIVGTIFILAVGGVALYVIKHDRLEARDKLEAARLAALETQAQAELKPLEAAFAAGKDDAGLRKQLNAFRLKYAEAPSAVKAASLLTGLHSPLDNLQKSGIAKAELEKGQPDNLVAVLGQRRWRHWGAIRTLAVSGTGSLIATAGEDGQVRIWNAASSAEVAAIPLGNVVALLFIQGDKLLACHTADGSVTLWNADKGTKYGDYPGPATNVVSATFRADGLAAASAQQDGTVKIWELESGKEVGTLTGHKGPVNAVAFAPDGNTVATAGSDGAVVLWGPTGNARAQLAEHTDAVTSVAFSKDSKHLASGGGGRDCNIIVWDVAKAESIQLIEGHEGAVHGLTFTADGKHIISGSADQTVRLWEVRPRQPLKPLVPAPAPNPNNENQNQDQNEKKDDPAKMQPEMPKAQAPIASFKFLGHAGPVYAVALFGEGDKQTIASAGGDCTVRQWSVLRRGDLSGVRDHQGPITSLVWLDDQTLASGSQDKTARVWDVQGTTARMLLAGHAAGVSSITYAPMTKLLATGGFDATVRIWDPNNSKELAALSPHMGPVMAVAFAPDGKSLVAGATSAGFQGGELKIWDPAIFKERGSLAGHADVVSCTAFAPNGRTFASGSYDGTVRLWEPWTGIQRAVLADKAAVESVAFAPDSKSIAVSTHAHVVKIWDVAGKETPKTLTGLTALCKSLSYSADGQFLAGVQPEGRVVVWNVASGEQREWKLPGPVQAVAIAPDGRHLATGNANGTIYLLRLAEAPKRKK